MVINNYDLMRNRRGFSEAVLLCARKRASALASPACMVNCLALLAVFVLFMFSGKVIADEKSETPPDPPGGSAKFEIRVFLQGFYTGNEEMRQAHEEKEDGSIAPRFDPAYGIVDKVTIELHEPGHYGEEGHVYAVTNVSHFQDGWIEASLPEEGEYYITIRTRNHLETVSAVSIDFANDPRQYDFTTSADKAYGSNQAHLGSGVYGIFAGDVNQDGVINITDRGMVLPMIGQRGYHSTDIDGNGYINIQDRGRVLPNIGRSKIIPN